MDGFRADYLDRGVTPNLKALADDGARGSMRPSFPSLTYPNHYTLVTGKRPDRNGVVGNEMEDVVIGGPKFVMNGPTANDPRWWNQAKPFWVSAEQQGKKSAAMFWPGSETAIDGVRPSHWMKYQHDLPYDARIDQVLAWVDSADGPPLAFATLYFDAADTEGHHYGPDSPELTAALVELDRCIGRLVEGLKARGRFETTDLIIVADHGMAPLPAAHRVVLDDLIDVSKIHLVANGAVTSFSPLPGQAKAVEAAFLKGAPPHMTCWKKGRIPAPFPLRPQQARAGYRLPVGDRLVHDDAGSSEEARQVGRQGRRGARLRPLRRQDARGVRGPRPLVQAGRRAARVRQCRRLSAAGEGDRREAREGRRFVEGDRSGAALAMAARRSEEACRDSCDMR
ncbi:ectonucleotide pyrophosphatase/phosphodiesterase [Caulobacter sp. UC70_42]|uniref:alkaline phosphatase family protein n=1 Tax=Caulobacter sp. UC70_42 TaxID=3374551 RepID=UPI0037580907